VHRLAGSATSFLIDTAPGEFLNIAVRAVSGAQVTGAWAFAAHSVSLASLSNASDTVRGVGVNLIPNAGMRFGLYPWARYNGGASEAATYSFSHGNSSGSNVPAPYGCVVFASASTSDATFTGFGDHPATYMAGAASEIPVEEGERYEVSAYVKTFAARSRLLVVWINSSGSTFDSDVPAGGVSTSESTTLASSQALASYQRLWGFVDAPAGAVRARVHLIHERPSTGAISYWLTALPYFGVAHPAQTLPSPWVEGANAVSTDLIADAAATEIIKATVASQLLDSTPTLFEQSFTPDAGGAVEITVSAAMSADLVNTGVGKAYCGLAIELYQGTSAGTLLQSDASRIIPWASSNNGTNQNAQGAMVMTYDVTGGQQYTVKVSKSVDDTKFTNVYAYVANLRVTTVKR
jgi:hypothetical protein